MDQELLDSFIEESDGLLSQLETIINKLEEEHKEYPSQLILDFSQIVDRMMGGAQTLEMSEGEHIGLKAIGSISAICKKIGYHGATVNRFEFVPLLVAFWSDTVEVLDELLKNLKDSERSRVIVERSSTLLQKRLEWLMGQMSKFLKEEDVEETLKKLRLR